MKCAIALTKRRSHPNEIRKYHLQNHHYCLANKLWPALVEKWNPPGVEYSQREMNMKWSGVACETGRDGLACAIPTIRHRWMISDLPFDRMGDVCEMRNGDFVAIFFSEIQANFSAGQCHRMGEKPTKNVKRDTGPWFESQSDDYVGVWSVVARSKTQLFANRYRRGFLNVDPSQNAIMERCFVEWVGGCGGRLSNNSIKCNELTL